VTPLEFEPPRRRPSQRSHLERLADDYGRAHGIAHERARRWLSLVSFAGALDSVRADDGARFLIKGGASMELRLGLGARTTKDIDVVFRGAPGEMLDALEEAFVQPYGSFSFRRKGSVEDIRETGSRRLFVQVSFAGKDWQTPLLGPDRSPAPARAARRRPCSGSRGVRRDLLRTRSSPVAAGACDSRRLARALCGGSRRARHRPATRRGFRRRPGPRLHRRHRRDRLSG
jgi:nucleotidyltransferase AbiEii toxin of type IV toxin-antitoxin system